VPTLTPLSVIERRRSHAALLVALHEHPSNPLYLGGLRVLTTGRFRPGGDGFYPSIMALAERDESPFGPERRFALIELVHVDDAGNMGDPRRRWRVENGTYDMTFEGAYEALLEFI
jgi:hypothetical protein